MYLYWLSGYSSIPLLHLPLFQTHLWFLFRIHLNIWKYHKDIERSIWSIMLSRMSTKMPILGFCYYNMLIGRRTKNDETNHAILIPFSWSCDSLRPMFTIILLEIEQANTGFFVMIVLSPILSPWEEKVVGQTICP